MERKEWFEEWFDSRYYHLLYDNRDENEARQFIEKLLNHLSLKKQSLVLDMGCGKGRHAIQLERNGYVVTGLDISPESIIYASQSANKNLSFFTHDMRDPFRFHYYDAIFSLFTSFGYFETMKEHYDVLSNNYKGLKEGGVFVIDFMNSYKVIENIVKDEIIVKKALEYHIKREVLSHYIKKHISFTTDGISYTFTESVWGFSREALTELMVSVGFKIIDTFGNYQLEDFDKITSDRLIIIAEKPKA